MKSHDAASTDTTPSAPTVGHSPDRLKPPRPWAGWQAALLLCLVQLLVATRGLADPIQLKVMTYNTHLFGELALFEIGDEFLPLLHKDEERKQELKRRIAADPADIILLQEVWSGAFANNIKHDAATMNLYPNFYAPNGHHGEINTLGLAALSKAGIYIKEVEKHSYKGCYGSGVDKQDSVIEKGFILMTCVLTSEFNPLIEPGEEIVVGVAFTHMITNQSSYDKTALCCYEKLDSALVDFQRRYPGAALVLAGDFNNSYRSPKYPKYFDNLILKDTGLVNAFDAKRELDIVYHDFSRVQDPDLIGAWFMDETAGALNDSNGASSSGVPVGTPAYGAAGVAKGTYGSIVVDRPIGTAITFGPGTTQERFEMLSSPVGNYEPANAFTAMAWVSPLSGAAVGSHRILGTGNLSEPGGWTFGLIVTNSLGRGTRIQFATYGTSSISDSEMSLPFDLAPGTYAHVAVSHQEGNLRFFLNGQVLGNAGKVGSYKPNIFTSIPTRLAVGGRLKSEDTSRMGFQIDGLRVYGGLLPASRVRAAALIGISAVTNSPLAVENLQSDLRDFMEEVTARNEDLAYTIDKANNTLSREFEGIGEGGDSPDHIFFVSGKRTKLSLPRNGIGVVQGWRIDGLDLSDHYPLRATFELEDPRIGPRFPKFKWSSEPDVVAGEGKEAYGELNPSADAGMVLVGAGCRVFDNNVVTLHLHVAPILADGTLGETTTRKFGEDPDGIPEVIGMVGKQEVVVGIGLRASGGNFKNMRLRARSLDPVTGKLGSIKEYRFGPDKDADVEMMLQAPTPSTFATGFGVRVKDNNVKGLLLNTGSLAVANENPRRYQAWRRAQFTAAQFGDESVSGPNADPDLDGANNLSEFVHGTNPRVKDAAKLWKASKDIDPVDGLPRFQVTIPRNQQASGVTVIFEESSDLIADAWTPIENHQGNAVIEADDAFTISLKLPRVDQKRISQHQSWPMRGFPPTSPNVYIRSRVLLRTPQ